MRDRCWDAWLNAGMELVLGSSCVICARPGKAACEECLSSLPCTPGEAWPTPAPPGLVTPVAVGEYAGAFGSMILAHKERGRLALARPLGQALALAVAESAAGAGGAHRLALVPVPSHPATVRQRGHDPLLHIAREASRALRGRGADAVVVRALRTSARPLDQAGLGAAQRARNVADTLTRTSARMPASAVVVVVDDIITTGSTLREAQRALESEGVTVAGHAVVAATRRLAPDLFA